VLDSRPESWQPVQRVVMEYHPVKGREPSMLVERLRSFGFSLVRERRDEKALGMYWFSRG
jgi:hypothetical protein